MPDKYDFNVVDESTYTTYPNWMYWSLTTLGGETLASSYLQDSYTATACWEEEGTYEYMVADWNKTWSEAQNFCEEKDGRSRTCW